MKLLAAAALVSVLAGISPLTLAKSATPLASNQQCTSMTQTSTYNAAQLRQTGLATILNGYFGDGGMVRPGKVVAPSDVVPINTEVLRLTVTSQTCKSAGGGKRLSASGGSASTNNTCVELGCIDDLGPTFSHLPNGSTAKIQTCGNSVETSRTYTRNPSGQWVLTAYSHILKDSCTID